MPVFFTGLFSMILIAFKNPKVNLKTCGLIEFFIFTPFAQISFGSAINIKNSTLAC